MGSSKGHHMSDADHLLGALSSLCDTPHTRPSIVQARMSFLPDWEASRIETAAQVLSDAGFIMEVRGPMWNTTLTSLGRARLQDLQQAANRGSSQVINIGTANNSPVQTNAPGAHGVQSISYAIESSDLHSIVALYHQHIDELQLDVPTRRKADAQVRTIEAQLSDEPDPSIVRSAGKSLKTIIEGSIAGAVGAVAANPATWQPLLALFG